MLVVPVTCHYSLQMGMESMFLDTADFSGIPAPETPVPLKVSKAIQKTFLEVNEEGSEAGAGTGMLNFANCSSITLCSLEQ